jgi:sugar/nucleoside kinase (ribokinase family)
MEVVTVGTVALDSVKTPETVRENQLGGSASYAALSASYFAPVQMVSIVGRDFPPRYLDLFASHGIGTDSIEVVDGGTFRWSGEYFEDMNTRETLSVAVNVLEQFKPRLSAAARQAEMVLLANCSPDNQLEALEQVEAPAFVVSDSMDLWINIARERLLEVLDRTDLFVINDGEARMFMGTKNTITAGHRLLELGPVNVVIKKGEHGALLFGRNGAFFSAGAYPLHEVHDPTGAGDSFAGGVAGYLASLGKSEFELLALARAVVYGTVMASYNCESFSTDRLQSLTQDDIAARFAEFQRYAHF